MPNEQLGDRTSIELIRDGEADTGAHLAEDMLTGSRA
jgi:hypothetical protein